MSASIKVNETIDIPKSMTGAQVIFFSPTLALPSSTKLDETNLHLLNSNGDVVLVVGFRRNDDLAVLNTRVAGGTWNGSTVRKIPGLQSIFGTLGQACIVIKDNGNDWQVFVNGNELAVYPKRISGDVVKVHYEIKVAQDSLFSDPVTLFIS